MQSFNVVEATTEDVPWSVAGKLELMPQAQVKAVAVAVVDRLVAVGEAASGICVHAAGATVATIRPYARYLQLHGCIRQC